jgi:UDP:flavonoid glycosyltransferase YjiC (YdhE family)
MSEATMKVAFLSLIADTGHVSPILKTARIFQSHGFDVLYIGPIETQPLAEYAGIPFRDIGGVRPSGCVQYMKVLTAKSQNWRYVIYGYWFAIKYLERSVFNGHQRKDRLCEETKKFDPDLLVADDHLFLNVFCDVANQLRKPLLAINSEGSFHKELDDMPFEKGFEYYYLTFLKYLLEPAFSIFKWLSSPMFMWRRMKENRKALLSQALSFRVESLKESSSQIQIISPGISYLESMFVPSEVSECHKTKVMGPLPVVSYGKLERELTEWLDERKQVIYVSFGTMVQVEASLIENIIQACHAIDACVLWVSPICPEISIFSEHPQSFKWVEWASQVDILKHRNIAAFITHGGAGAVQESIFFGVPMVIIPHIWDQFYNARRAAQFGVAVRLNRNAATKEQVVLAIEKALTLSDQAKEISHEFAAAECSENVVALGRKYISHTEIPGNTAPKRKTN